MLPSQRQMPALRQALAVFPSELVEVSLRLGMSAAAGGPVPLAGLMDSVIAGGSAASHSINQDRPQRIKHPGKPPSLAATYAARFLFRFAALVRFLGRAPTAFFLAVVEVRDASSPKSRAIYSCLHSSEQKWTASSARARISSHFGMTVISRRASVMPTRSAAKPKIQPSVPFKRSHTSHWYRIIFSSFSSDSGAALFSRMHKRSSVPLVFGYVTLAHLAELICLETRIEEVFWEEEFGRKDCRRR